MARMLGWSCVGSDAGIASLLRTQKNPPLTLCGWGIRRERAGGIHRFFIDASARDGLSSHTGFDARCGTTVHVFEAFDIVLT